MTFQTNSERPGAAHITGLLQHPKLRAAVLSDRPVRDRVEGALRETWPRYRPSVRRPVAFASAAIGDAIESPTYHSDAYSYYGESFSYASSYAGEDARPTAMAVIILAAPRGITITACLSHPFLGEPSLPKAHGKPGTR